MKKTFLNLKTAAATSALMMALVSSNSLAQQQIDRPIKVVVGYSPGGTSDILARIIAESLRKELGQSVIVENRPGASGTIASLNVKSAKPDGTTLMIQPLAPMVLAPQIYKDQKIDTKADFTPIAQLAVNQLVVATDVTRGARSIAELSDATNKIASGGMYAIPGVGGLAHMIGAQMSYSGKVKWEAVPYKAALSYLPELGGGEVAAAVDMMPELLPLHQGGKIRIIAVSSSQRSPALPDVPTLREQGLPSAEAANWYGVFGPADMPAELVEYLNKKLVAAVNDPATSKKLMDQGFEPKPSSAAELKETLSADYDRWAPVIKQLDIRH